MAADESGIAALTGLIRDGGVIVTTASPAPGDPDRGVRGTGMQLRADAAQLASLAKSVDTGDLTVDVSASYPLTEIATVHTLAAAGRIRGKVLLVPTAATD